MVQIHKKIMIRSGHNFIYVVTVELLWHVWICDLILSKENFHEILIMSL